MRGSNLLTPVAGDGLPQSMECQAADAWLTGSAEALSYLALVHNIRNGAHNAGRPGAKHLPHSVPLHGCCQVIHGEVPLRHLKFTLFGRLKSRDVYLQGKGKAESALQYVFSYFRLRLNSDEAINHPSFAGKLEGPHHPTGKRTEGSSNLLQGHSISQWDGWNLKYKAVTIKHIYFNTRLCFFAFYLLTWLKSHKLMYLECYF